MKTASVGGTVTAVVDKEGHLYTWGTSNKAGQLGREGQPEGEEQQMPHLIDFLSTKVVTQVSCGHEFGYALGQNFDTNGEIIEASFDAAYDPLMQDVDEDPARFEAADPNLKSPMVLSS